MTPRSPVIDVSPGGFSLLLGGAGTGKTTLLLAHAHLLVDRGMAAEQILLLAPTPSGARGLRELLEASLTQPFGELCVHDAPGYAERLLRSEPLQAGVDPFFVTAGRADRIALLAQHLDELALVRHDFLGRPTALLASLVTRIDRLKDELVDAESFATRAAERLETAQPDEAERDEARLDVEFAQVYLAHDALLAAQGALDHGELVARACRLLTEHAPARRRAAERHPHVLVDDLHDLTPAALRLIGALAQGGATLLATADERQAVAPHHGATPTAIATVLQAHPQAKIHELGRSHRCPPKVLAAAAAVVDDPAPPGDVPSRGGSSFELSKSETRTTPPHDADTPAAEYDERPEADDTLHFLRAAGERAQAQAVAAEIERLMAHEHVPAGRIAILVRSVRRESRAIAAALAERGIPHHVIGAADLFQRPQVRDVLAWMRLLTDPRDAAAASRTLVRPPIELRSIDLARVVALARRRRLDMVGAVYVAIESPQTAPEARERMQSFLRLRRSAERALDTTRPDIFIARLIDRLGLRRAHLLTAQADGAADLLALARLGEVVAAFQDRAGQATARELATYLSAVADAGLQEEDRGASPPGNVLVMSIGEARGREFDHVYVLGLHAARMPGGVRGTPGAGGPPGPGAGGPGDGASSHAETDPRAARMRRLLHLGLTRARRRAVLAYAAAGPDGAVQPPSPLLTAALAAVGGRFEDRAEELFGPAETLHGTLAMLRAEVLGGVGRIAGRLSELRLDTDLDVAHGVVSYLELIKLAALIERPGEDVDAALADVNQRLQAACTPLQRDLLARSPLDAALLAAAHDDRARALAVAARDEPSLEAFLPRQGEGLLLSASDLETYRSCPLRYKFARVLRIPAPPTLHQRFGILVHQVLERYHAQPDGDLHTLGDLLAAGWRRGGFGDSREERQLHEKAQTALHRYHERLQREPAEPVWFERQFTFRVGPHRLRGRVDRVDRLDGDGYELIDYKTGRPRTAAQLEDDIQLSLYAVGAREAWQLEASSQAYYYVLDDRKVAVPRRGADERWIADTVNEVAEGILSQEFEPTPSYGACSNCDYRILCPAAEG